MNKVRARSLVRIGIWLLTRITQVRILSGVLHREGEMVIDSKNLCSGQNRHLRNLTHLVKKTKEGNRDWSEEKMKHGTKFLCSRDNGDPLWEFCQYDSDLRFSLSHGDGFKNHLYKENEEGYSLAQELMTYLQSNYGEKNE